MRPHSRRIEASDHLQDLLHLLRGGVHPDGECQIVRNGLWRAAQVTVGIEIADDVAPDGHLVFGEGFHPELVQQVLDKGVLRTLRRNEGIAVALRRVVPLGGSRYVVRRFVLVHVVRKVEVVPILTGGLVCPRGVFPRCLVRRRVLGRRFGV